MPTAVEYVGWGSSRVCESNRQSALEPLHPAHNALGAPRALHPLVEDRGLFRDRCLLLPRHAAPEYRLEVFPPVAVRPIGADPTSVARTRMGFAETRRVSTH